MRLNNFRQYRHTILSHRCASSLWRARQNILSAAGGRPPVSGPYMVEFDMTYRCNCRCEMCQRWRDSRSGEMTLNDYRKLADAFSGMGVHLVSMAGGEPLLRKDIFTIIKAFARHGMAVNLCTNGILLNDHVEALCNCGAAFITVSIDGAAPETHEAIRGAPGTFCRIDDGIRSWRVPRPPVHWSASG